MVTGLGRAIAERQRRQLCAASSGTNWRTNRRECRGAARGGQWVSHVVDRDSVRHGEHELGVLMPAVHHDGG
jgi:hypothetical protein